MRQSDGALAIALAFAIVGACGGTTSSYGNPSTGGAATPPTAPPGAVVITIQSLSFTPLNVTVPPGSTITVRNLDGIQHSVTSEATMGAYAPGAVNGVSFDTGLFSTGDRTITIPASAPAGTVVPYFCRFHLSMMPQGTITVQAGPAAARSQDGAPGAGPQGA